MTIDKVLFRYSIRKNTNQMVNEKYQNKNADKELKLHKTVLICVYMNNKVMMK